MARSQTDHNFGRATDLLQSCCQCLQLCTLGRVCCITFAGVASHMFFSGWFYVSQLCNTFRCSQACCQTDVDHCYTPFLACSRAAGSPPDPFGLQLSNILTAPPFSFTAHRSVLIWCLFLQLTASFRVFHLLPQAGHTYNVSIHAFITDNSFQKC